jgi:pyruvate-formate lyase-activating enzyme
MELGTTTVHCPRCRAVHSARWVREGHRVLGVSDCPAGTPPVELTDDAELFLRLRALDREAAERCRTPDEPLPRAQLYITEDCNWRCPVCYAASGPDGGGAHLPLAECLRRARDAKSRGLRRLILLGGEPTVHPELEAIISGLRALGLTVSLVSNGQRLADEPALARRLKAAGLAHVNVQFDTLEPKTLRRLRGQDDVELKQRAIRHLIEADLPYSLTVTVTELNLPELGAIVRWAAGQPVLPSLVLFQSMVASGRFPEGLTSVSREAMIREVLRAGVVAGATVDHLHVLPRIPAGGIAIHPDCGAILVALRRGAELVPGENAMDIARLVQALTGYRDGWRTRLRAGWALLRSPRPGSRWEAFAALLGLLPGRVNRRLMLLGFTSFCSPDFLDERRLARCADHVLLANGTAPVCRYFGLRSPNSEPVPPRTSH